MPKLQHKGLKPVNQKEGNFNMAAEPKNVRWCKNFC